MLVEFIRICREHKPVGQWPGERLCTAIERVMEREKPFRFIAEADMAPERGHNGRGGDPEWQRHHGYCNAEQLTVWGCRLFDNETDARKSFG